MKKIIVSDMMCIHCEKRIKEALERQNIKCEIRTMNVEQNGAQIVSNED